MGNLDGVYRMLTNKITMDVIKSNQSAGAVSAGLSG